MKNFKQFFYERSAEEIMSLPSPKGGKWLDGNNYVFNVEGDTCNQEYCYNVKFEDLPDIGNKGNGVMISFTRDNMMSDQRKGFGQQVFDGVRKAIGEFIQRNKPGRIVWAPVDRSSKPGLADNPNARSKAYDIWAVKSIWPQMYVSYRPNEWVRRDIYDQHYAGKGYPAVPPDAKTGDRASMLRMRSEYENRNNNKNLINKPSVAKPPLAKTAKTGEDPFMLDLIDIN